jgi:hypothetical protein
MLLLLACSGGGIGEAPDTGESCFDHPSVEIGGTAVDGDGRQSWIPMAEGDAATMVHGPQGGWHVLASAYADGVGDIVRLTYTIVVLDSGAEVSWNNYTVQLAEYDGCGGMYPGMYGYLDVSGIASGEADTPPELLAGATLLLGMDLEDRDGRTARDELTVIAALDPQDEPGDTGG